MFVWVLGGGGEEFKGFYFLVCFLWINTLMYICNEWAMILKNQLELENNVGV